MHRLTATGLGGLLALTATASAHGQTLPQIQQFVSQGLQQNAQSPIQGEVGRVIGIICPPGDGRLSADLQDRCNEIVDAVLFGGATFGGAATDGLAGLQNMGNEEDSAVGTSAVDVGQGQGSPIENRVRAGRGGGLVSAIRLNGEQIAVSDLREDGSGLAAGAGVGGPWTFFVDGSYARSDRDATARQSGFETDSFLVAGGVEYSYRASAFAGLGLTYGNHDADLDAGGGDVETDEFQVQLYGSISPATGWYLDAILGYGWSDIEQARNINYRVRPGVPVVQTARSDTDSDSWWASARLSYDLAWGAYSIAPYVRIEYAEVDIDGFRERMSNPGAAGSGLATEIDAQEITSLPLGIGITVARAIATAWGQLVPQVALEYVHEFDNDNDPISGRFVDDATGETFRLPTDPPDRDYGLAAVGASLELSETASAHLVYQTLIGFRDLDTHLFQAGMRLRW